VLVIMLGEELRTDRLVPTSTFPVVVGERGGISRCRIPFSAQTRSNNTSAELPAGPNRPVKTLPLSVKICSRTPCRRSAASSASHTGWAVPRRTSLADTANRELSSIPDTAFNSVPSTRWKPPTTSICHNSIGRARSHRR
jgi:hypothetical protein